MPSIDALNYIGVWQQSKPTTSNWTVDPYLRTDHALYGAVRRFVHVRRSCATLTQGSIVWRDAQPAVYGLIVFSRIWNGAETVVVINPSASRVTIAPIAIDNTINYNAAFQTFRNLLLSSQTAIVGYANDQAYLYMPSGFTLDAHATMIMVHSDLVGAYDQRLQTNLCAK